MRRREFITLFGGAAGSSLLRPLAARAQQAAIPVIGYLGLAPASSAAFRIEALRAGLDDLGYADGKNVVIDFHWAEESDQLREFAADIVQHRVAAIVSSGNAATLAAKSATSAIPIVFAAAIRLPSGRYRMVFEAVDAVRDPKREAHLRAERRSR